MASHHCNSYLPPDGGLHCMYMSNWLRLGLPLSAFESVTALPYLYIYIMTAQALYGLGGARSGSPQL